MRFIQHFAQPQVMQDCGEHFKISQTTSFEAKNRFHRR